jgi:glycosyltransferase involved in cell wall biosynthesis
MDNIQNIDILMATKNGEKYLCDQIDSIINQTYQNWNLIIKDDNSSDNTIKILSKYKKKFPDKITLIKNKISLGAIGNFASLFEYVKSNYIMFCDQDDIWLPDKISLTYNKIIEMEKKYGQDLPLLVFSDLYVVDENMQIISDSFWKFKKRNPENTTLNRLFIQNVITGCTVMVNKILIDSSRSINNKAMMHDWWLGLIASSFGKIDYINQQLIYYRQHENNKIGATQKDILYFLWLLFSGKINSKKWVNYKYGILNQAELFHKSFKNKLNKTNRELIENFINLRNDNFFKKRYKIFKYGYFCNNLLDNIEVLIRI